MILIDTRGANKREITELKRYLEGEYWKWKEEDIKEFKIYSVDNFLSFREEKDAN